MTELELVREEKDAALLLEAALERADELEREIQKLSAELDDLRHVVLPERRLALALAAKNRQVLLTMAGVAGAGAYVHTTPREEPVDSQNLGVSDDLTPAEKADIEQYERDQAERQPEPPFVDPGPDEIPY